MPQADIDSPKSPLRSLFCLPAALPTSGRRRHRSKTGFSSTSSGDSGTSASSDATSSRPSGDALSLAVSAAMPMALSLPAVDEGDVDGAGHEETDRGQQDDDVQRQRIKAMLAGPPTQIIPLGMTDEWDLEQLMQRNFKTDKFRVEMRSVGYKVWAPRKIRKEELQRPRERIARGENAE